MNPYGIQQVDVPGLLSVYQGARQARAQEMLAKKQQEAAERQADREQKFSGILAKWTQGGGVGGAFGGQQAQPSGGAATAAQAFGQPSAAPQPAMQQPRNNFRLSPETMSQLIAVDPNEAAKVFEAFSKMDTAQHEASQRVNDTLGRAAQHLLTIPEDERQAEIQRIAPILMEQGIDEAMISQFAPTERNLQFLIAQSRDIEKLREEFLPKLRNAGPGDIIIDENRVKPGGNPRDAIVFESPFVEGPDGAIYERVPNAPQGQSEAELRAAADEAIRQGADPAAVNARLNQMLGGGGGGNATGNFPGG